MSRLTTRIRRLEVRLLPAPPFVMTPVLIEAVDRLLEGAPELPDDPATAADMLVRYFGSVAPDEEPVEVC